MAKKISRHLLNQSEVKPKPSLAPTRFPTIGGMLLVFASRSDRFIELSASSVVSQSNYFGIGFTFYCNVESAGAVIVSFRGVNSGCWYYLALTLV